MRVHKKVAGFVATIGDLKEFIKSAEAEGFTDSTRLNPKDKNAQPPFGVLLYVNVTDPEDAGDGEADSEYAARCPECRRDDAPSDKNGILLVHYRGETEHPDTQCYGVGKKGYQLRKIT